MLRTTGLLLLALTGATQAAAAQAARAPLRALSGEIIPTETPSSFRITAEARRDLRRLWQESTGAGAERVACLDGRIEGDSAIVTRIGRLEARRADSTSVSAQQSIDECGPPRFLGTVHTHLNVTDERSRFAAFSGADRGVMYLWWKQWQVDGIFCVLYTAEKAHCELVAPGRGLYGHGTAY